MSVIVCAAIGAAVLFAVAYIFRRKPSYVAPPYHDTVLPTSLGRMFTIWLNVRNLHEFCHRNFVKHGWVWRAQVPPYPETYVCLHPDDVNYMLAGNFENFEKGPDFFANVTDLLGYGIFAVDGDLWHKQRQAASHLFKRRLLRYAVTVFCENESTRMKPVLQAAADSGELVDVQREFGLLTMSAFLDIAFGSGLMTESDKRLFTQSFDKVTQIVFDRQANPLWWLTEPFTTRPGALIAKLDAVVYRMIEQYMDRKQAAAVRAGTGGDHDEDDDDDGREDVLARFVKIQVDEQKFADRKAIRDVVINLLLGGRDTTAQMLTWSVYLLARHPEKQRACREEVLRVVGANGALDMETVAKCAYVKAVLDEALRLYPPVSIDMKVSVGPCELPHSKFYMPGNTALLWSAYCMGRSEHLWDAPLEFRPERWLDPEHPVDMRKHIPFQTGPRVCLGKRFAYLEGQTVVCALLRQFCFEWDDTQPEPVFTSGLTFRAANGVPVRVRKVSK